MHVWYHGGYVKITVTHRNFTKATKYSFCQITINHRDSEIGHDFYQESISSTINSTALYDLHPMVIDHSHNLHRLLLLI
jgi:hypothetical protein